MSNVPVIDAYRSGCEGCVLVPGFFDLDSRLAEDPRPFDLARYGEEVHAPVALFTGGPELDFPYRRCLDMPLRLAGTDTYALPSEWARLAPLVTRVLGAEHASNPSVLDYHCYLTVDSGTVAAGEQQRRGGLHVDGFQGARIALKTRVTRGYVVVTNGPTRFYPQLFEARLDDAIFNVFEGFDLQAGEPVEVPERAVVFMDAYTVHEAGRAAREGQRTFVRITFDLKRFDRAGNTHNSMVDYSWPMYTRDVHAGLRTPTGADLLAVRPQGLPVR